MTNTDHIISYFKTVLKGFFLVATCYLISIIVHSFILFFLEEPILLLFLICIYLSFITITRSKKKEYNYPEHSERNEDYKAPSSNGDAYFDRDNSYEGRILHHHKKEFTSPVREALPIIIGIFLVFFAIPCLIIYWRFHPNKYKKAIQISSLFVSAGSALIYYKYNSEKLPSVADKAGFFTGVSLFPPGALEFLLD